MNAWLYRLIVATACGVAGATTLSTASAGPAWSSPAPLALKDQGCSAWSAAAPLAFIGTPGGRVLSVDWTEGRVTHQAAMGAAITGLAAAADGPLLMVALRDPPGLALLDTSLQPVKTFPVPANAGSPSILVAGLRRSFVVTFEHLPELWEISYDPKVEDFYEGLVHDFRMGEGVPTKGYLGARRMRLPEPLRAPVLDAAQAQVLGPSGGASATRLLAVNLDVRRVVSEWQVAKAGTRADPGWPWPAKNCAHQ